MKYLKEYYDFTGAIEIPKGEIEDMAKTKKFNKFLFGKPLPETSDYTGFIKNKVFKNFPMFDNDNFGIFSTGNVHRLQFVNSKFGDDKIHYDIVLEVDINNITKKIKVGLLFYINSNEENLEEDSKFLDSINIFPKQISFENLDLELEKCKNNISKFEKYCYGKYGE
jgi:hypothetical protein